MSLRRCEVRFLRPAEGFKLVSPSDEDPDARSIVEFPPGEEVPWVAPTGAEPWATPPEFDATTGNPWDAIGRRPA